MKILIALPVFQTFPPKSLLNVRRFIIFVCKFLNIKLFIANTQITLLISSANL